MNEELREIGAHSDYWEMDSDYGHDAFLVEQEKMISPLLAFMRSIE
jgi:homoserine acetyltransferase